jgi:hypothetical protein
MMVPVAVTLTTIIDEPITPEIVDWNEREGLGA